MVIYYFQPPDGSCIHQLPLQTHDLRSQWLIHLRSPRDSLKNGHVEVKLVVLMIFTTFYIAQYCFFWGKGLVFPQPPEGNCQAFSRGGTNGMDRNHPLNHWLQRGGTTHPLANVGPTLALILALRAPARVHGARPDLWESQLGDQFYHTFLGSKKPPSGNETRLEFQVFFL